MFPAAHILKKQGVKVGLGFAEDNFARGLVWEAGWVYATSSSIFQSNNLTEKDRLVSHEALGMVTWDMAEITGMKGLAGEIRVNEPARYLVYNADPIQGMHQLGGLASHLQMIMDEDHVVCHPKQF